jgi:glycosyltransferase involved in cell wall biosynthesis
VVVVGIDSSRNRSGGAVAHLRGLIEGGDPRCHGIGRVHVWAYDELLDYLPQREWLTVHAVPETKQPIGCQLWWQYARLPVLATKLGVDILYNSDAGSVCPYPAAATLSQDMLSFEPGEMQRYPFGSRARLRLEVLRSVQLRRLGQSRVAIFLTDHAREVIGRHVKLRRAVVIPHGIDASFRALAQVRRPWPRREAVRCVYVSNAAPYKHQWSVIEAVAALRRATSHDIRLRLVGGGRGSAIARLQAAMARFDPNGEFVETLDFLPHDEIPAELAAADLFVFASSCENLPITLLEAMASGIPICSSDRGPMPEVLGRDACYFDPEVPSSIAQALKRMIEDDEYRERCRIVPLVKSATYTWEACAEKTWRTLASTANEPT